ncbi:MAG: 3-phosphoshikimate 1-carboxyvinyltransferase [Spirochaetota bacterium]
MDRVIEGRRRLRGALQVPGDKSISHRSVLLGSIARGTSRVWGLSSAMDVRSSLEAVKTLGIQVEQTENETVIKGMGLGGLENKSAEGRVTIHCGNSGTTARLLTGLLAGAGVRALITGDESLSRRPMSRITEPLASIGAGISSNEGRLPMQLNGGKLVPFEYVIPVASAQVKTSLILASLFIQGTSYITEPVETRDHTERMLLLMDGQIKKKHTVQGKSITVCGRRELSTLELVVPGDISSAAFFIASGLVTPRSDIVLENVLLNPTRAYIIEVFQKMGGNIQTEIEEEFPEPRGKVRVWSSRLKAVEVGGIEIPLIIDEIPALACAGFFARGETIVRGASELRVKESDRIRGVVEMIRSFGGRAQELDDGFVIHGPNRPTQAEINSFGDHRLAMAASIIALNVKGRTLIRDAHCSDISFPGFFDMLESATVK